MFLKPLKIKSNNQLKGTERKKLYEDILAAYPVLTDNQVQQLIPKKEALSLIKIVAYSGETCKLYCVSKVPMFFQFDQTAPLLYPTIYTLWQYPDLLYSFKTHEAVIAKLVNGASLMLPGIILDGPPTLHSYGKLAKNTPVAVITEKNKAAIAVGVTAHSSEDMYMAGGRGKCVDILHIIGDSICQLGKPLKRPQLNPESPVTEIIATKDDDLLIDEPENSPNNEELTDSATQMLNDLTMETDNDNDEPNATPQENNIDLYTDVTLNEPLDDPVKEMDRLLEYCLLKACKGIKKSELPLLSSNFFKNHLLVACPSNQTIDIKKSSFKKLSVFLASMKAKGVIDTTILKGVESIIYIQSDHPLLKDLVINEVSESSDLDNPSAAPVVSECYKVTADVLPILSKFGYEKGDIMKKTDIRKCLMEYIKTENLQDGKTLKINPQLAGILRTKESVITLTIEDGINKFIGRMTHTHQITVAGTTLLHTGRLEPIDITVSTRANKKKVTLVNNLEVFGIKLNEFSKECQGIGASATITDVPGKKSPSVLVQGNQVLYVYKLLTEKYRINKNYIRGLEYAPKKRK
ncbi:eukaryotic translation initiation factor 2D [Chelonus insularis]|uniref:eukaryotic translation initiation factor 2D n=1 Tax=Chelonus insularis TaxID=460826 RepID=UPI00158E5D9C|nr:eukaryotic translation initiation factor 2D [Chelonus insularis]XP_034948786.1 eukaryotic translation initiation factor 2D [Chelonus insularis]